MPCSTWSVMRSSPSGMSVLSVSIIRRTPYF